MSLPTVSTRAAAVDRRLSAAGIQIETAVAFMGCLIILGADAQGLSLIPLVSSLEKTFTLTPGQASWVLSAPGVVAAGCIPTFARLGDRFGMRPLVLLSLLIAFVANLLCALAPTFALLVAARGVLGMSAAVAYLLSGFVIQANGNVRTVLWALTVLSGITVLAAWWILPDTYTRSADPVDWAGAALVSVGLVGGV